MYFCDARRRARRPPPVAAPAAPAPGSAVGQGAGRRAGGVDAHRAARHRGAVHRRGARVRRARATRRLRAATRATRPTSPGSPTTRRSRCSSPGRGGDGAGMAPALASAMRKVRGRACPRPQRDAAGRDAGRILVRDGRWRRTPRRRPTPTARCSAPSAPLCSPGPGCDLRYAARDEEPRWRTVDPVGLVSQGGRWYLLALRDGQERTYRLSRVREVRVRDEQAVRPPDVDLDAALAGAAARRSSRRCPRSRWRCGCARADGPTCCAPRARCSPRNPRPTAGCGSPSTFGDAVHAERALWSMAADVEVLAPGGAARGAGGPGRGGSGSVPWTSPRSAPHARAERRGTRFDAVVVGGPRPASMCWTDGPPGDAAGAAPGSGAAPARTCVTGLRSPCRPCRPTGRPSGPPGSSPACRR